MRGLENRDRATALPSPALSQVLGASGVSRLPSALTAVKLPKSPEPPHSGKTDPGPTVLGHLETQREEGGLTGDLRDKGTFVQGLRTTSAQRPEVAGRDRRPSSRNVTSNKERAARFKDKRESEQEAHSPRASWQLGPYRLVNDKFNFVQV